MTHAPAPAARNGAGWITGLLAGVLAIGPVGCVTPARPGAVQTPARPLAGEYVATFHTTFAGPVRCRMTAEPTDEGFKANTRPGVAWTLFSGLERLLGPLFAPYLFPSGMILTWQSSLPHGGRSGEGTIGVGTSASLRVTTRTPDAAGPTEIIYKDGRLIGLMTLEPLDAAKETPPDYAALAASANSALASILYDPALADSRSVRAYQADLLAAGQQAQDDVELLFGAYVAAKRSLTIGTPLLYRTSDPAATAALFAGRPDPPRPYQVSRDAASGITTLRMDAFVDEATVDAAFREALTPEPRALILDFRTFPGLGLTSLRAAAWLVHQPLPAGTYVGPSARKAVPVDESLAPVREIGPGDTGDALELELAARACMTFLVTPRADSFRGPVAILTSRRCSGTAEALAVALVHAGRVMTVGEPTAGRPYLSREVPIGQGWALRAAGYDYRDPDGESVGAGGLPPTVPCSKDSAPQRAAEALRATVAAAMTGAP